MMDESRAHAALHEIRTLELEMAHRLEEARASAAASVDGARAEARRAVASARELGARRAEERHRTRVAQAEEDAARIRTAGEAHASELLETLGPRVLGLVDEMMAVVLTAVPEMPIDEPDEVPDEGSDEGW